MKPVTYTLPERLLIGAAFVMFAAMIAATLGQVLFRYFLQISVPWTEEAARALFVMANLTGIAIAYREREHIIVDFLFTRLPPKLQRGLSVLFSLMTLGFLAFWARGSWAMVGRNWNVELITAAWFRVAYFYVWELGMIALMAVYILLDIRGLVTGKTTSLLPQKDPSPKTTQEAE